jgi:uncharacterized membrane protein
MSEFGMSSARKNYTFAFAAIGGAAIAAVILVLYQPPAPATAKPLLITADSFFKIRVGEDAPFFGAAKGGTPPYQFEWDFGDGSVSQVQNATHVYTQVGNYTVTLTVSDSKGAAQDVAHTVNVYPPDANFTRADDISRR